MLLHAPTPLVLADLTALTTEVAAEVHAGLHPVTIDPERRWYRLLRSDSYVDVWLISWATEQTAELHDHAGSLGALTGRVRQPRGTALGAGRPAATPVAGRAQRRFPARARARRGEPGGGARRERACLFAAR